MADIRIDQNTAERLIARILRDNKLSAADSNRLAAEICTGLRAAMPSPTRPGLQGWRMIPEHIPHDDDRERFLQDIRYQGFAAEMHNALVLWKIVYQYGRPVPDDVVV
jgi:hypothetical protein